MADRTQHPETGTGPALPADAAAGAAAERRCPLCGLRFPADGSACHAGCPIAKSCKVLCCPNCGYEFVEDSAVASGIAGLFRRLRGRGNR